MIIGEGDIIDQTLTFFSVRSSKLVIWDFTSGSTTPEALKSHTESIHRDKVVPAVEKLRGRIRDHRITLGFNSLKASTLLSASPPALGVVLTGVGLGPFALVAGAGLSFVLQSVNYRVKRREILRSSPFSYQLQAEWRFGRRKRK